MVRKTTKSTRAKTPRSIGAGPAATLKAAAEPNDQPQVDKAEAEKATDIQALVKRDLIDRVVMASGVKKKAAKPVVEAVLKELGDALSRGETLNLQPFGKANVKRMKDVEHAEIIELRLRRSKLAIKAAEAAAMEVTDTPVIPLDPLAEAAE